MDSYLTLIASNPQALRLPKINGQNDLATRMGVGVFNSVDDIPEAATLFSLFSFDESHVKKTANSLNFASFSGFHCLSFNLLPFRFYSTDGEQASKEARLFLTTLELDELFPPHVLFQEIKADNTAEAFLFIHASVCGALLYPSRSLCDELYALALHLNRTYPSLDAELYSLRTMLARSVFDKVPVRGDWPVYPWIRDLTRAPDVVRFADYPPCLPLQALILESMRVRKTP